MKNGLFTCSVGLPEIVIIFPIHVAESPGGRPFAPSTPSSAIPVAPVVVKVIGVNGVFIQSVWSTAVFGETVLSSKTVIVPFAKTVPQPPVSGIE